MWCDKENTPPSLKTCSLVPQCGSCGQRTLVIQGDVSVCIEGSMQPQRPRRISLRGSTWRLLSNYKPTQMLDERKGQGCILTMNSQKCFISEPYLTLNYIQYRWHTVHICHYNHLTTLKLVLQQWVYVLCVSYLRHVYSMTLQWPVVYAGSLPLVVLCCRLCRGCFSYSGLSLCDLHCHAKIPAVSNETKVPAVYFGERKKKCVSLSHTCQTGSWECET